MDNRKSTRGRSASVSARAGGGSPRAPRSASVSPDPGYLSVIKLSLRRIARSCSPRRSKPSPASALNPIPAQSVPANGASSSPTAPAQSFSTPGPVQLALASAQLPSILTQLPTVPAQLPSTSAQSSSVSVQLSSVSVQLTTAQLTTAPAQLPSTSAQLPTTPTQLPSASAPVQKISASDLEQEKYSAWSRAFATLDLEDQKHLDKCDIHDCLKTIKEATEKMKQDCDGKRWTCSIKGETIVLRDVANKFINWIDRFKAIGDIVSSFDPVHAALPWAGFRFLLEIVTADSNKQGAILVGLESVANLVDRCTIYECLHLQNLDIKSRSAQGLDERLVGLYAAILIYLSKCKSYYSRGTMGKMANAVVEPNLDLLMKGIEDGAGDVHRAAEIANMECSKSARGAQSQEQKELKQQLEELEVPILRMDLRISDLHQKLLDAERSAILKWISTMQYGGHHKRAKQNRLGHSGRWFLAKKGFKDWRNKSASSLLWLHGIPGAGKTKLVSLVVDTLIEAKNAGSQEALAFFYCDRNEPERSNPESILRAIVRQLSYPKPGSGLLQPIVHRYQKTEEEPGPLDLDECRDLIIELLSSYPQSNIVIDALDECEKETRSKLIAALATIMKSAPNLVKIFVSSREDGDIVLKLKELPNIRIDSNDNSRDIERFVESEVEKRITEKELLGGNVSDGLKTHIINTIVKGADGMFMWVHLQITNLCDSERFYLESDVRAELGKLPKGLKETYSAIFQKISSHPEQSRLLATKTLKWIMCAQTPLSPTELISIISAEPNGNITKNQDLDKETILRFCHNLVVWDSELNVMRFAHLSVQEYLEESAFKMVDAHHMAAEICLYLLCLPNNQSEQGSDEWTDIAKKFKYHAYYWSHHVRSCGQQSESSNILLLQKQFFHLSPKPSKAYYVWKFARYIYREKPLLAAVRLGLTQSVKYLLSADVVDVKEDSRALVIACDKGWETIVQLLLDHGARINSASMDGETALIQAAEGGHEPVVRLLLGNGADPNIFDCARNTALLAAVDNRHEPVVRLLLENGADPNISGKDGEIALLVAVRNSQELVVRLLLENRADPDKVSLSGESVLSVVAYDGNELLTQLLLNKGANISLSDERGRIALLKAASEGHEPVVRLLLDNNDNPNHSDKRGCTALIEAARNGHEPVVQLLLDNKVDLNHSDKRGRTALMEATSNGHMSIVQQLLDNGVDPSHPNRNDQTANGIALLEVARNGCESVVQQLLDNGADPNYQGNDGVTALIVAAGEGHIPVARRLLDSGADDEWAALLAADKGGHETMVQLLLQCNGFDLNKKNEDGEFALLVAVKEGRESMVQLLLGNGTNPNLLDNRGQTVLFQAASEGYEPVVKLLLEGGADPNLSDKRGRTALLKAARKGHLPVVQLLLDKGADLNHSKSNGSTPLLVAIKGRHESVVQLLLECGADPNSLFGVWWALLHFAAMKAHGPIVQLLLEKGADPHRSGPSGWTALLIAVDNEHGLAVQLLLENGVDPNHSNENGMSPLFMAAGTGHKSVVQLLLESGADPKHTNRAGRTALFKAARKGHGPVVQLLLENGANPNHSDKFGWTALMVAADKGHESATQLLLESGANPNHFNEDGKNALLFAAEKGYKMVVQLLLDNGVDRHAADRRGCTALSLATWYERQSVITLLQ